MQNVIHWPKSSPNNTRSRVGRAVGALLLGALSFMVMTFLEINLENLEKFDGSVFLKRKGRGELSSHATVMLILVEMMTVTLPVSQKITIKVIQVYSEVSGLRNYCTSKTCINLMVEVFSSVI